MSLDEMIDHLLDAYRKNQSHTVVDSQCQALIDTLRDPSHMRELVAQDDTTETLPFETRKFGEFELTGWIGAGGMGQVYRAVHAELGCEQALKMLPPERVTDAQAMSRFKREIRAIGQLNHPSILTVYDAGQVDGTPYLAMELIDGRSLSEIVRDARREGRNVDVDEACRLIADVADGIQHAHENGVLHRDIKPGNLMMDSQGRVRILDLGLAKIVDTAQTSRISGLAVDETDDAVSNLTDEQLTAGQQILGTPDYMSPEQIASINQVDARSDVYSLAATLYYLLTGQTVFTGSGSSLLSKAIAVLQTPAPRASEKRSDLPEGLDDAIAKALSKNPDERPQTAAEFAAILRPYATPTELPTNKPTLQVASAAMPPLRRAGLWLLALLPLGAALAALLILLNGPDGSTLRIESDDPDVKVIATWAGETAKGSAQSPMQFEATPGKPATLRAGHWIVSIDGDQRGQYELSQTELTLKDGETKRLVVTQALPKTTSPAIVTDTPVRHMDEGLDWSPEPANQSLAGLALQPAKFSDYFDVGLHLHRVTLGIHDQWSSSRPHFDVSPDGKRWIYSTGKELILRDIASQEILALVTGSIENVWTHVEFSPDGQRFAAIDQTDHAGIEIRDLSGRLVSSFHYQDRLHRSSPDVHGPAQIRWLPNGSELLVWNPGRAVVFSTSGEVKYSIDLPANEYQFPKAWRHTATYNMTSAAPSSWRTCVHPDGQHVSFMYGNGKIVQWDLAGGALTQFASVKLAYNQRSGLRWNMDGQRLLVWCTSDKADQQPVCRLYSPTGEILHESPTNSWQSAVWSPDGKSILTDRGHILDDNLQQTKQLDPPEGFTVSRIPFWKSANEVIFANSDKNRYLRSGMLRRFRPSGAEIRTKSVPQPMAVDRATFSSDGDIYSTHISDYEKVQVFHWTNSEQPTGTRQHEVDSWGEGCWNQSGTKLVLRGRNGQSFIDLESGQANVERFSNDESDRQSVIYSPDGQFLAYYADGEKDQVLIVPQNGAKPIVFEQGKLGIAPVFSRNSRWLVWGSRHSESSTLNLLDLKSSTQEPVEIDLAGHRLQGPAIFSPNSRFLSFIVRLNGGESTAFNGSPDDGESTEQLVVRDLQTSQESRHPIVWNRTQSPVLSWSDDSSRIFAGDCYQVSEDGSLELEFAVEHDAYAARFMNLAYFTREGNLFVNGGLHSRLIDSHGELLLETPLAQTLHRPGPFGRALHRHENQFLLLAQRVDHPFSLAVLNGEQGSFAWNGIAFQDGATLTLSAGGNVLDGPKEIDRYLIHSIRYTGGRTIALTRQQLVQRLQSNEAQQAAFWAIDQGAVFAQEAQESVKPEAITKLDFSGNLEVAALELQQLPLFSELQELILANTTIDSLPSLEGFRHLETIDLEGCSAKDISGLADLSSVKVLNLGQTAIQAEAGATLATLKNLETLNLSETAIDRFTLLDLASLKNLKELILFDVDVTRADIEQFQQELPDCRVRINEETPRPTDAP